MAVKVKNRNGREVTLLNPSEKGTKFVLEMRSGVKHTNDFTPKVDKKSGELLRLTKDQQAYRAGYLDAQKDSSKAFKAKHPRYKSKKDKSSSPSYSSEEW